MSTEEKPKIYLKLVCDDDRVEKCWETGHCTDDAQTLMTIKLHLMFKDGSRFDSKGYLSKTGHEHIDEANEFLKNKK